MDKKRKQSYSELDSKLSDHLSEWAKDEIRSVNAQN
jgi:hypothetical protein